MVSLPFLAAALIAPGPVWSLRTGASLLAVFSLFLLRDPLVRLLCSTPPSIGQDGSVPLSLVIRPLWLPLGGLAISGSFLLLTLPVAWVVLLGAGGLALAFCSVVIARQRIQREIAAQLLGVAGLTASSLPAYLAGRGELDWMAAAIWTISAAHSAASVLVVRARLEAILSSRRGNQSRRFFRSAVGWQAGQWSGLAALALSGYPALTIPFLLPGALHAWELWQFRSGNPRPLSMHQVGWIQLIASASFYALLVPIMRLVWNA